MYVVSFKVRKTNKEGKYMFTSLDSARQEKNRLKSDKGLKSVNLKKIGN